MYPSNQNEFMLISQKGEYTPVYDEYSASLETPLSVFLKVRQGNYSFLLESVERGQNVGRYSFIGTNPYGIFSAEDGKVYITENKITNVQKSDDPLVELEKIMKKNKYKSIPGMQGFTGGAVGYLGYDMMRYFEDIPSHKNGQAEFPECMFMFFDTVILYDHVRQVIQIITYEKATEDPASDYKNAVGRIAEIKKRMDAPIKKTFSKNKTNESKKLEYMSNMKPDDFHEMVKRAKNYIEKGDIFQVVLAQRLLVEVRHDPVEIYRELRSLNPSPYMFFLHMDKISLVGSSPEMLVKVEKEQVEIRPIAGTRPRGDNAEKETLLEKELIRDEKEKAEHLMLLDLGRNDLGRIASYNSVRVDRFMEIEKYSHVMHLVSKVIAELSEKQNCFDVLRACFPAGTVSGAPKIRAMQIIDELEQDVRGPYAGAVGYINYNGDMDTCITIRTLIIKGNKGYIQAGAGIVADSDPQREYIETLDKAKALLKAVEKVEGVGKHAVIDR